MVSKVAIIAIVAMVALPIGLGYLFNQQDVSGTRWTAGTETDVTNLISKGNAYTFTSMNSYEINGPMFRHMTGDLIIGAASSYPDFQLTSTVTSIPLNQTSEVPQGDFTLSPYSYWELSATPNWEDMAGYQLRITWQYSNGNWASAYLNRVVSAVWNAEEDKLSILNYTSNGNNYALVNTIVNSPLAIRFETAANWNDSAVIRYERVNGQTDTYADVLKGYTPIVIADAIYDWWKPPAPCQNALFTVDLSTTQDDIEFKLLVDAATQTERNRSIYLDREVVEGAVSWTIDGQTLVYDENAASNTYQIEFSKTGAKLYYLGEWPNFFGKANFYREWSVEYDHPVPADLFIEGIRTIPSNGDYPTMRVDAAGVLASSSPAIVDYTYNPAQLLGTANVQTTIPSIAMYGKSLTFGGETYTVTKGHIEVGTRSIDLVGATFQTIVVNGQYEFRINGYTVGTSPTVDASQSVLTFNGTWRAQVVSAPVTSETFTDHKWIPGAWGWKGLDANFALVGLLTCLVCFVGLGIYGKRSGSKVGTLMIICTGGALIFMALL